MPTKYRAARIAAGLCVDCASPQLKTKRRCWRCAANHRDRERMRYHNRPTPLRGLIVKHAEESS